MDCPDGQCQSSTSCSGIEDGCGGICDQVSQACNPDTKNCECKDDYPQKCLDTLCCKSDWTCDTSGERCCQPDVNKVCKKDSDGDYKLFKADSCDNPEDNPIPNSTCECGCNNSGTDCQLNCGNSQTYFSKFISDENYPDNDQVQLCESFTKMWKVRNQGPAWSNDGSIVLKHFYKVFSGSYDCDCQPLDDPVFVTYGASFEIDQNVANGEEYIWKIPMQTTEEHREYLNKTVCSCFRMAHNDQLFPETLWVKLQIIGDGCGV